MWPGHIIQKCTGIIIRFAGIQSRITGIRTPEYSKVRIYDVIVKNTISCQLRIPKRGGPVISPCVKNLKKIKNLSFLHIEKRMKKCYNSKGKKEHIKGEIRYKESEEKGGDKD